jgi:hypothetical protein
MDDAGGVIQENILTEGEAAGGLKEALTAGVSTGTSFLGKTDGFLKNEMYKVLLPQEVRDLEAKIQGNMFTQALLGKHIDNLVTAMNRGAENAMAEAKPIFVNAITSMTITDAINIVTGGDGAGTNYLKRVTSAQLKEKFQPVIKKSLDEVNATQPWKDISTIYNQFMAKQVTTDLDEYVTDKAMTALFTEINKQENLIRANPVERTTDLLKKVFAYADSRKG